MWIDRDSCVSLHEGVDDWKQCRYAIGPDSHTRDVSLIGELVMDDAMETVTFNTDQGSQTIMVRIDDFGWGEKEPQNTKNKWYSPDISGLKGLYCWELN